MNKNKMDKTKIAKKKGGIFINTTNYKEAFEKFLKNSKIKYLSRGASGITFMATLNEGVEIENNYIYSSSVKYGEEIKYLIVKLGFSEALKMDYTYIKTPLYNNYNELKEKENLTQKEKNDKDNAEYRLLNTLCFLYDKIELKYTNETEFINEVNSQCKIYLKTIDYLQPVCPGIVFSNIYTEYNEILYLLFGLRNNAEDEFTKNFLGEIYNKHGYKVYKNLTVIGMEYVETSEKAETLLKYLIEYDNSTKTNELKEQYELYINMGRFIVLYLTLRTGYTHGDFHSANIMINKKDETYFKGYKGSPVIIDFGHTQQLEESKLNEFRNLCEEEKYVEALRLLCSINRPDGLVMNKKEYTKQYGWICGNYNLLEGKEVTDDGYWEKTNDELKKLFKARTLAVQDLVDEFNIKHDNEPDKYPSLPLDREFKTNKIFHGIKTENKRKITDVEE